MLLLSSDASLVIWCFHLGGWSGVSFKQNWTHRTIRASIELQEQIQEHKSKYRTTTQAPNNKSHVCMRGQTLKLQQNKNAECVHVSNIVWCTCEWVGTLGDCNNHYQSACTCQALFGVRVHACAHLGIATDIILSTEMPSALCNCLRLLLSSDASPVIRRFSCHLMLLLY